jgi:hypothetical protein
MANRVPPTYHHVIHRSKATLKDSSKVSVLRPS